ncbi:MAG: hypothetical protein C0598_00710 [Marinilabiliales bacterium]|nr:MAG: hypothetical protein C0598_00710 [Marinilabiliales bacterium]
MIKKKFQLKFTEILIITFVWVLLITAPVFFRQGTDFNMNQMINIIKTLIPLFIIFVINRFLLVPKLLFEKKNTAYILSVLGLVAIMSLGIFFIDFDRRQRQKERNMIEEFNRPPRPNRMEAFPPPANSKPPIEERGPMPAFLNLIILSFLLVGFDTGLMTTFRLNKSEQQRAKLEIENAETQLAFLKSQISPHFFMNTLNNIHSLIDIDGEEAKASIIQLSKLMRHLLYESENKTISLKKEIEFIRNYVDLMMLRFSNKVDIKLYIPDELPNKEIAPLLFISYIENAFKHGISYKEASFVKISFYFNDDKLIFETENSNFNLNETGEKGIGISNSKQRLDLLYGNNYNLTVIENKEIYKLHLSIPI